MVEAALSALVLYVFATLVTAVTTPLHWAALLPLLLLIVGSVGTP